MDVPFFDLKEQHRHIASELEAAIARVFESSHFVKSQGVVDFEKAFADWCGVEHCLACGNGSDAILIALKALGIRPGDEVIVPAFTWISTSSMVTLAGGVPVFCDVDPISFTLDPHQLTEKLTERTVGMIPVHLYGHPAKMFELCELAKRHDLWVLEDCAQAHGATFHGKKVGTFGDMAIFSFFPTKSLGAVGDAGAVITDNPTLIQRAREYASNGTVERGIHRTEGMNSRMDSIQAAVLHTKLSYLDGWVEARAKIAETYIRNLSSYSGIRLPNVGGNTKHGWHLFVIKVAERDKLKAHLAHEGIGTEIHYPRALPFQECYSDRHHQQGDFPVAAEHQDTCLSLPLFPELSDAQINRVTEVITKWAESGYGR